MTLTDSIKNIATLGAYSRQAQQDRLAAIAGDLAKSLRDISFTGGTYQSAQGTIGIVRSTNGRTVEFLKQNVRTLRNYAEFSWVVRAGIDIYRDVIERAEWMLRPADPDKGMSAGAEKDIRELLTRPNDLEMSYSDLQGMLIEDYLVLGHGVLEKKLRRDGAPMQLLPLDAARLGFVPTWDGSDPTKPRYSVTWPGSVSDQRFLADPMAMVLLNRRRSYDLLGLSHVEIVDLSVRAMLSNESYFLEESLNPTKSGILNVGPGWNQPQIDQLRTEIDFIKRAFSIVASEKADYVSFNPSEREMRMLDKQDWFVRSVAAVFQIPIAKLQVQAERMNRAATEAQFQAMDDGPASLLWRLRELENRRIVQAFGPVEQNNIRLDYPIMSKRDEKMQAEITKNQMGTVGYLTINEARADNGEEAIDLPIADEVLVNVPNGPPVPLSSINEQYFGEGTEPQPDDGTAGSTGQPAKGRTRKALKPTPDAVTGARKWWKAHAPAEAAGLVDATLGS